MLKMLQISSLVRYSSFPMVGRCVSIRISTARMALTMSRRSSLNAALSRVMISSVMLQAFYQVLFQKLPDVVVPEQYFIPQGRIGDDAGGAIVLQGSLGDAQGLADLLSRKPPDSCRLGGEGMERRHSLQKTLKVRLHLFIGARFHKDAIHNAEGLGDFCVKDVQDNPSLQKTIPMSAPDRSSPLKGKNDRCPVLKKVYRKE